MVKIKIGNAVSLNLGGKKKKEESKPAPPPEPPQKRCPVCGNYASGRADRCPRCNALL
jgi:transposase